MMPKSELRRKLLKSSIVLILVLLGFGGYWIATIVTERNAENLLKDHGFIIL